MLFVDISENQPDWYRTYFLQNWPCSFRYQISSSRTVLPFLAAPKKISAVVGCFAQSASRSNIFDVEFDFDTSNM